MKQKTAIVLAAPPVCMLVTVVAGDLDWIVEIVWMLCSFVCLASGISVLRTNRRLGWLCIGFALVQFGLLSLPFILPPRHVKNM